MHIRKGTARGSRWEVAKEIIGSLSGRCGSGKARFRAKCVAADAERRDPRRNGDQARGNRRKEDVGLAGRRARASWEETKVVPHFSCVVRWRRRRRGFLCASLGVCLDVQGWASCMNGGRDWTSRLGRRSCFRARVLRSRSRSRSRRRRASRGPEQGGGLSFKQLSELVAVPAECSVGGGRREDRREAR